MHFEVRATWMPRKAIERKLSIPLYILQREHSKLQLFNKTYSMNLNENQNVQLTKQNFKAIFFLLTDDVLVCKFKHQRWREFRFMESTYLWYYSLYFDLYKNVAVKLNETCVLLCAQELKKNLLSKLCLPVLVDF